MPFDRSACVHRLSLKEQKHIKRPSPFGVVCPRKVVPSMRIVTQAASFLGTFGNIVVECLEGGCFNLGISEWYFVCSFAH